jgi:hypothetical protein
MKLLDEILHENIKEEVQLTLGADNGALLLWEQSFDDNAAPYGSDQYPMIGGSFDMAWQQRSSGQRYNSQSGHGLLMGSLGRKPLALIVKSKVCNICSAFDRSLAQT